jgi:hypothetical protein
VGLKHSHAGQAAQPIDIGDARGFRSRSTELRYLDLVRHLVALQSSFFFESTKMIFFS